MDQWRAYRSSGLFFRIIPSELAIAQLLLTFAPSRKEFSIQKMLESINDKLDFQPYNSNRPQLVIPEYGRNIQRMIEHAMSLEDKEQRNKCAHAVLSVMGQLFPYLRDIEDFNHKLWDHLHIMAKFNLDVDSTYPKPDAEHLNSKPDPIPYPNNDIQFGHYGYYVQSMILKCAAMEEGDEKQAFALAIANVMKYNATNWNRNIVHDDVILKDLNNISKGKVKLVDVTELQAVKPLSVGGFKEYEVDRYAKNKHKFNKGGGGGGGKKKKFRPR